ncbi:MAG: LGFP repeat-containing protein [Micromonosporaceae bacterium]
MVEVIGGIRERWHALGGEGGWLGHPVSGERDFVDGGRVSDFQHGAIYWWPDTGAIEVGDVVVRYRGMSCVAETDEPRHSDQPSHSDEPYAVVGVLGFDGQKPTFRTRIHENTGGDGCFPDPGAEVFRGRPWGLDLSVTFMEHDEGDPNAYRDKVHQAVSLAADRAKPVLEAALASTGFLAPLAVAVGPVLDAALPDIVGGIDDLLGTADDTLGTQPIRLGPKQLITSVVAPHQRERDLHFHVASPLVSGGAASYQAYFDVVRA